MERTEELTQVYQVQLQKRFKCLAKKSCVYSGNKDKQSIKSQILVVVHTVLLIYMWWDDVWTERILKNSGGFFLLI